MAYYTREEFAEAPEPIFWRRPIGNRSPEEVWANIHVRLLGKDYRKIRANIYKKWKEEMKRRRETDAIAARGRQWFLQQWNHDPGAMRRHFMAHDAERAEALEGRDLAGKEHYYHNYGYDQYYVSPKNLYDESSSEEDEEDELAVKALKKKSKKKGKRDKSESRDYHDGVYYDNVDVHFDRKGHRRSHYGKHGRPVKHITVKMPRKEKRKLVKKLRRSAKHGDRCEAVDALGPALRKLNLNKQCKDETLRVGSLNVYRH